jgi:hypothetical protein
MRTILFFIVALIAFLAIDAMLKYQPEPEKPEGTGTPDLSRPPPLNDVQLGYALGAAAEKTHSAMPLHPDSSGHLHGAELGYLFGVATEKMDAAIRSNPGKAYLFKTMGITYTGLILCPDSAGARAVFHDKRWTETSDDMKREVDETGRLGEPDLSPYGCSVLDSSTPVYGENTDSTGITSVSAKLPDGTLVQGITRLELCSPCSTQESRSPVAAQSQTGRPEPYGFNGDRLGMGLAEFQIAHEPLVGCVPVGLGIVSCGYRMDANTLELTGFFVDSKLAGLWISTLKRAVDCFDDKILQLLQQPGPQGYLLRQMCGPTVNALGSAIEELGSSYKKVPSPHSSELHATRWETTTSVAEFQAPMCIKTGLPGAWFLEVLEGRYCGDDDKPSNFYFMIYLDKQAIRTAIARLSAGSQQ